MSLPLPDLNREIAKRIDDDAVRVEALPREDDKSPEEQWYFFEQKVNGMYVSCRCQGKELDSIHASYARHPRARGKGPRGYLVKGKSFDVKYTDLQISTTPTPAHLINLPQIQETT